MIFYILGLTGVGKTTLCEYAGILINKVCHKDLDIFINPSLKDGNHWSEYFKESKRIIETLEKKYINHENIIICDVGAGIMKISEAFDYFRSKENVISIYDKPENIFERVKLRGYPWEGKTPEEFKHSEFTEGWQNLFSSEEQLIFTVENHPIEESKDKFVKLIEKLISGKTKS